MTHRAPSAVRKQFAAGLRLLDRGLGGSGLVDQTIDEAREIASGLPVSDDKVHRMAAWFARHDGNPDEVAARLRQTAEYKRGELSSKAPALVAHLLWGGEDGKAWAYRITGRTRPNPTILDHYVEGVLANTRSPTSTPREALARAYAISVSSLQKQGLMKPGTMRLTAKGRAANRKHEQEDTMARKNPHVGQLIYLTPAARKRIASARKNPSRRPVRRNPWEARGKYADEGLEFEVLRGPRAGKFKILGRGTGKTAKTQYAKRKVGTYAVQYEGKEKEKYLPTRYLSQLYYRTTPKGQAAVARARAKYLSKKKKTTKKAPRKPSKADRIENLQRAYEAAVMAGSSKAAGLKAKLLKARKNPSATKRGAASSSWFRWNPTRKPARKSTYCRNCR